MLKLQELIVTDTDSWFLVAILAYTKVIMEISCGFMINVTEVPVMQIRHQHEKAQQSMPGHGVDDSSHMCMLWVSGVGCRQPCDGNPPTRPSGTQAVRTRAEPRPRKTLSVCTPVNSPWQTARSHL